MQGPPNEHTYISVIINSGEISDEYGIGAQLTEHAKELYYKYGRWYDELRVFYQTHQQFRHIVILVYDGNITGVTPDNIKGEVSFWLGNVKHRPSLKLDDRRGIVIYSLDSVNSTSLIYQ